MPNLLCSRLCTPSKRDIHGHCQGETDMTSAVLRSNGFQVVELWEHEFAEQKKKNQKLQKFSESHSIQVRLNPRDAFFDGCKKALRLFYEGSVKYVDFTWLYPWIKNIYLPSEEVAAIQWQSSQDIVNQDTSTNIFIAAFTTPWTRLKLYQEMDKLERKEISGVQQRKFRTKSSFPSPTKSKQKSAESGSSKLSQQDKEKSPISKGKYPDERSTHKDKEGDSKKKHGEKDVQE
ncbi:DNA-directed DNA polymerase [Caerostris darwini]|uniref:DNA-directed DNA polymerase n=1 Tax=Caerostris darwini TaxID=1538125 RepID=A0AAV4R3K6_9ARAC|nr:DNA-directed DNA polymerase [Caerostris darwini]